MKVILIPCAANDWRENGRLLGRAEIPLAPVGQEQCSQWAELLRPLALGRIFHSPDELASRTATFIGRRLAIPTKPLDDLVEVDMGLWAGLTESQLKTRFASAHRQLLDAPLNVHPPGGESLGDAASRLQSCLRKRLRRNGKATVGLVLRPLSFAMTRQALLHEDEESIWPAAQNTTEPIIIELNRDEQPAP